jgi:hypothetical protein
MLLHYYTFIAIQVDVAALLYYIHFVLNMFKFVFSLYPQCVLNALLGLDSWNILPFV